MRRHTPRFVTLASAVVLLFGCTGDQPLAPPSSADAARAATTLAAPSSAVAVAVSENRIDVQWKDNSSDETRFEILRSTSGATGQFVLRATAGVNAVAYSDVGLQPGTQYCYSIRAVRTTGAKTEYSPISNIACTSTKPVVVVPTAPPPASGAVAVPSGSASVTLGWTGLKRVGDTFRVERSTDGAVWQVAGTVSSVAALSFEDAPLPSELSVCYRVVAYNAMAAAEPSNTACTAPPAAPSAVTVRQVEPAVFDLSWRDDSAVEDGYELRILHTQCANDGWGSWYCFDYEDVIAVLPADSTTYRLPSWASPESGGRISVRAMNDGGYSDATFASYVTAP